MGEERAVTMVMAYLIVLALTLWSGVWMLVALWKAARRDQLGWFIACAVLGGLAGAVPMLYIFWIAPKVPELAEAPF